ncbi:hypothetical protein [Nocardia nova]|uniref:hypothetical protein n=1 Tax=Nocardia nova TaxID=37330 RepID=UPI0034003808
MKLLAIDYRWSFDPAEFTTFSELSCYDYDIVVWDPKHSLRSFKYSLGTGIDHKVLTLEDSIKLQSAIARRKREFRELVESGRTLVILGRPPMMVNVDTGERTVSGKMKTIQARTVDLWSTVPAYITSTEAFGKFIEIVGQGAIQDFLRSFSRNFHYEASIELKDSQAVAKLRGSDRVIGATINHRSGGKLIVLPVPEFAHDEPEDDGDDPAVDELAERFQVALLESVMQLSAGKSEPLPAWSESLELSGEVAVTDEIVAKELELARIQSELTDLHSRRKIIEDRKYLVTGTGRRLELEIRKLFEALGGRVEEPEPGRDDWIVHFSGQVAVVEVKGVNKSATEAHLAQLEKWVSNYYEENNMLPKAILIVNTWRKKSLMERTEDSFPNQMLPYATSRNHCLITGVQALAIREHILEHPEDAGEMLRKIFDTVGEFPLYAEEKFGTDTATAVDNIGPVENVESEFSSDTPAI